jgi:hypothetical protein
MRRGLLLMWAGTVLPFLLTIVNGGPDGRLPHLLSHPTYVGFLGVAIWGVRRVRAAATSRSVRGLATGVAIAAVAAMLGHFGEFIAVLQNGGFGADETVFDTPLHSWSANVTVPAILVAIVLTAATSVAAALARSPKPGATLNRGVRSLHRWTSVSFVLVLPLAFFLQEVQPITIVLLVAFGILLITGLQMSIRHYGHRWRRRQPPTTFNVTSNQRDSDLSRPTV